MKWAKRLGEGGKTGIVTPAPYPKVDLCYLALPCDLKKSGGSKNLEYFHSVHDRMWVLFSSGGVSSPFNQGSLLCRTERQLNCKKCCNRPLEFSPFYGRAILRLFEAARPLLRGSHSTHNGYTLWLSSHLKCCKCNLQQVLEVWIDSSPSYKVMPKPRNSFSYIWPRNTPLYFFSSSPSLIIDFSPALIARRADIRSFHFPGLNVPILKDYFQKFKLVCIFSQFIFF